MEYEKELDAIRLSRTTAYRLSLPIVVCLALGIASSIMLPFAAPIFGVAAFAIFYQNLVNVARMPCPKCNAPFGTDSTIVFGFGTNSCQRCGLSLFEDRS